MPGIAQRISDAWAGIRGKSHNQAWVQAWLRGQEHDEKDRIRFPYKQHPWIKAGVTAVARAVARPELQVFQGKGKAKRRIDLEQPDHPLVKLLMMPNPTTTGRGLRFGTTVYLETRGNAIWVLETGRQIPRPTDPIVEIRMPAPWRIDYKLDPATGNIDHWILDKGTKRQIRLEPFEVIHFKYFNPWHDILGLEEISAVKRAMDIDQDAIHHLRNLMRHGTSIGAYLQTDDKLDTDTAKTIQRSFGRSHQGPSRVSKRIPVLHSGMQLKTFQPNNREMQLLELVKGTKAEFAAGMLVPPILLGDWDRATFNNAPVQERILYEWNSIPKTEEMRDRINVQLAPRFGKDLRVDFDFSRIQALQRTLGEEISAATAMQKMGVPLEVIENLFDFGIDLKNIPWKKTFFVPAGMVPAEDLLLDNEGPPTAPTNGTSHTSPQRRKAPGDRRTPLLDRDRRELWAKAARPMIKPEVQFRRALLRHFFSLRAETLRRIRTDWRRLVLQAPTSDMRSSTGIRTKAPTGLTDLFAFDLEQATRTGQTALIPIYTETAEEAAKAATIEIGLGTTVGPEFVVPEAVRDTLAFMPNRVKGFDTFVHQRLKRTIAQGIVEGASVENIAKNVKTRFRLSAFQHAPTIARTEVATAFNITRQGVFVGNGIKRHQWLTSGDDLVRESHLGVDGEVVQIGEVFSNGLLYPNDPTAGDAGEVINCRCIALPVFEGEESAGA